MTPLPPLPAPEAESAAAGQSPPTSGGIDRRASQEPPFPVVRGKQPGPGNGTHLLLSQPFIVEDLSDDEGPLLITSPLKYLRFDRDSGCCVDHPVHSKPPHGGNDG